MGPAGLLRGPADGALETCLLRMPQQLVAHAGAGAALNHCSTGAIPALQVVQDANTGEETELTASMVVNAAGLHAQVRRLRSPAAPAKPGVQFEWAHLGSLLVQAASRLEFIGQL